MSGVRISPPRPGFVFSWCISWIVIDKCPASVPQKKKHLGIFTLGACFIWGDRWGSNPRQLESQSRALPAELRPPLNGQTLILGVPDWNRTSNPQLRRLVLYPVELRAQFLGKPIRLKQNLVGVERFELPTSCSQSRRATRLRYTPKPATIPS